jgi:hypothetical protein
MLKEQIAALLAGMTCVRVLHARFSSLVYLHKLVENILDMFGFKVNFTEKRGCSFEIYKLPISRVSKASKICVYDFFQNAKLLSIQLIRLAQFYQGIYR